MIHSAGDLSQSRCFGILPARPFHEEPTDLAFSYLQYLFCLEPACLQAERIIQLLIYVLKTVVLRQVVIPCVFASDHFLGSSEMRTSLESCNIFSL
jgi:hypothetical protein